MKWFIASDIHGSAYYCRKMLERYKAENADRMLLLGDILYHGTNIDNIKGGARATLPKRSSKCSTR